MRMSRWALMISGRGSNMAAVSDLIFNNYDIRIVISNRSSAPGIVRARRWGLPTMIVGKDLDWENLNQQLRNLQIDRLFLLGFMKIVPEVFIKMWAGRIFNLHPSLLPDYKGLDAIEKSYQDAAAMGVSVHHVIPEMDAGKLLFQQRILQASSAGRHSLTLEEAQFLISREEQRLVREAIECLSER